MTGPGNTCLTVVLPIWIGAGLLLLVQWLIMRRVLRKPPAPHPDIVCAGRRLYEDGDFKREIVQRIPCGLFDDQVHLACGHETTTMRNDSETHINCHQCAQRWIDQEARYERTVARRGKGKA